MVSGLLSDSNYPGMFIDLRLKEDDGNSNGVTVEYDKESKDYVIRVWKREEEDYVARIQWNDKTQSHFF